MHPATSISLWSQFVWCDGYKILGQCVCAVGRLRLLSARGSVRSSASSENIDSVRSFCCLNDSITVVNCNEVNYNVSEQF